MMSVNNISERNVSWCNRKRAENASKLTKGHSLVDDVEDKTENSSESIEMVESQNNLFVEEEVVEEIVIEEDERRENLTADESPKSSPRMPELVKRKSSEETRNGSLSEDEHLNHVSCNSEESLSEIMCRFDGLNCVLCTKPLGTRGLLIWQGVGLCGVSCLENIFKKYFSRCFACHLHVTRAALGKFCVRLGAKPRQFCGIVCLDNFKREHLTTCAHCQLDLKDPSAKPIRSDATNSTYCSMGCKETVEGSSSISGKCPLCQKNMAEPLTLLLNDTERKFCSEKCMQAFVVNGPLETCLVCGRCVEENRNMITFSIEGKNVNFCSKQCSNLHVLNSNTIVPCAVCKVSKYSFDMIRCQDMHGVQRYFCNLPDRLVFTRVLLKRELLEKQGNSKPVMLTPPTKSHPYAKGAPKQYRRASHVPNNSKRSVPVFKRPLLLIEDIAFNPKYSEEVKRMKSELKRETERRKPRGRIVLSDSELEEPFDTVDELIDMDLNPDPFPKFSTMEMHSVMNTKPNVFQGTHDASKPMFMSGLQGPTFSLSPQQTILLPSTLIAAPAVANLSPGLSPRLVGPQSVNPNEADPKFGFASSPSSQNVTPPPRMMLVNAKTVAGNSAPVFAPIMIPTGQIFPPTGKSDGQSNVLPAVIMKDKPIFVVKEKPIIIPVPVPVYVPTPMAMYNVPYPVPIPIPFPVPVPLILPETLFSGKGKPTSSGHSKMNSPKKMTRAKESDAEGDPLQEEILQMAEAVEEYAKQDEMFDNDLMEVIDYDGDVMVEVEAEEEVIETSEYNGEDILQAALSTLGDVADCMGIDDVSAIGGQAVVENRSPKKQILEVVTMAAEDNKRSTARGAENKRIIKSYKKKSEAVQPRKVARETTEYVTQALPVPPEARSDADWCLKYTFGLRAWKMFVNQTNAALKKQLATRPDSKVIFLKSELLECTLPELCYGLSKFVSEVKKTDGSRYSPDLVYYLCLGIQAYLFENGRTENIFSDILFSPFTDALDELMRSFSSASMLDSMGYVMTHLEEEHLWESQQLGAHSPHTLLNSLMYFATKYFLLKTPEMHQRFTFLQVLKNWANGNFRSKDNSELTLKYHPQGSGQVWKSESKYYEMPANLEDRSRCPIQLYDLYVSKCPKSVRGHNSCFYLVPERNCVAESPVWFSTQSLSIEIIRKMLNRIVVVREIQDAILNDE